MSCRASPASARSLETSTSSSNALFTSPGVSAEKRARSTWSTSFGFALNHRERASRPLAELGERPIHRAGGKRREARPLDVVDELRVRLEHQGEGFDPYKLPL